MFFGRNRELREIEDHCDAGRFVVVTAAPGMGLTTLLREGLAPRWQAQGCIVVYFREWQGSEVANDFREAVTAAVCEQADAGFFAQPGTLAEMLERIRFRTGRPVALLLDQFEDYLRCHFGTDVSDFFDAELAHAIAGREGQFVIALQDHAVEAFQRFSQYIPNLLGSRTIVGPLDSAEARGLVIGAAAADKVKFEPAVVEALLSAPSVRQGDGVHPFFLMMGVQRLIEAAGEKKVAATGAGVIQIYGGADRLILESLDARLSDLGSTRIELFFRWCNLLLSDTDQRLAVTPEGLMEYAGKLNRFGMALMPALMEVGILRTVELPGGMRYEIARECYAPLIRDWWRRREAALIARRRAQFRVRSISVAIGSIVLVYIVWLIMSLRK